MTLPILSFIIWLPILGALGLLLFRKVSCPVVSRLTALLIAAACFGLSLILLQGFDIQSSAMQWQEAASWIPSFQIYYSLGIDGFSLPLILLTCLMSILVILASFRSVKHQVTDYCAAFLMLQGLMCGVFAALDAVLFYTFWEAMLIPMYLIIGIWGGSNRVYASMKFFLYTFLGSVLLLIAIIYLQRVAQGLDWVDEKDIFNLLVMQQLPLPYTAQKWLFLAFFVAFSVKIPMWPVHTWLPDAHVEAPTGGSVILAAILLKMGGYGFLRFILPITPDASQAFASGIIALSLIAIVYIALVAIVQKDMKKLIAYSSISHMGFVTLGLFLGFSIVSKTHDLNVAALAIEGSLIQMISHGFISGALFLGVGVLYDRLHSRQIKDYGGVVNSMPVFAAFFMLFAMANVGLPGTSGFIGEFLVIVSAYKANFWIAAVAATILILGASYTLWMYKRVIFGAIVQPKVATFQDIQGIEKLIFIILGICVIALGLWPQPLIHLMEASTKQLVVQMLQSKL